MNLKELQSRRRDLAARARVAQESLTKAQREDWEHRSARAFDAAVLPMSPPSDCHERAAVGRVLEVKVEMAREALRRANLEFEEAEDAVVTFLVSSTAEKKGPAL